MNKELQVLARSILNLKTLKCGLQITRGALLINTTITPPKVESVTYNIKDQKLAVPIVFSGSKTIKISIVFDEDLRDIPELSINSSDASVTSLGKTSINKIDGKSFYLEYSIPKTGNAMMTLELHGVKDVAGNEMIDKIPNDQFEIDNKSPSIESIGIKTGTTTSTILEIKFSEVINTPNASDFSVTGTTETLTPNNYTVDSNIVNDGGVSKTMIELDLKQTLAAGQTITIANSNITDLAGNAIAIPTGTQNQVTI